MKQVITLILSLLIFASCVSPSQTFLARKHNLDESEIKMIWEGNLKYAYSPFLEMKNIVDFTELYMTSENCDSIAFIYNSLLSVNPKKTNCITYDVVYHIQGDTINQRVYFIESKNYHITHDNDIINQMKKIIETNLSKVKENKNVEKIRQNDSDSIFI